MRDAHGEKAASRESRNKPALDYPATVVACVLEFNVWTQADEASVRGLRGREDGLRVSRRWLHSIRSFSASGLSV